ncbi:deoxyhypusine synthase [Candidatus Aerophobetes bacterium]|nr:deoxyhypusine synthase [Candidatus Aerophobetes bacterium]
MMNFRKHPVKPFTITGESNMDSILQEMESISFQARSLGASFRIWKEMLKDETFIFLGLAGAMVPAGMRKVISYLIDKRLIDCLVSTGANLFHDCYESLGKAHYQTSIFVDDEKLKEEGLDRIYDTLAPETGFRSTDEFIRKFAEGLDKKHFYTTREFFYLLGKFLEEKKAEEGIVTTAYKRKVPIYCPAVGDSSLAISLAAGGIFLKFDVLKDVYETAYLAEKAKKTGVIYIGGGTPKNFIQQTQVTLSCMGKDKEGHSYAIQITCDASHWGGLSGCTMEEAQSWGKISIKAKKVTCYCDATIALPLLVEGLASFLKKGFGREYIPQFVMDENMRLEN